MAAELTTEALGRLGLAAAPDESTLRKLFARLDTTALDRQLGLFAWTRTRHVAGRRVIAIDAKTIRGARDRSGAAPHLLAALQHGPGVVLGQVAVNAKSNKIPAARDLLAELDPADLHGCVMTLDAMHTQVETAQAILTAGADYMLTIKANQPKLLDRLKTLPWDQVPPGAGHRATTRGHGRRATRTIPDPARSSRRPTGSGSPAPPRSRSYDEP